MMKRIQYAMTVMVMMLCSLLMASCGANDCNGQSNSGYETLDKAALKAALTQIAIANPDGFTVDATTLKPIEDGYAVSLEATQNSFGDEGLDKVIDYVTSHSDVNAYGGWLNSDNNMYYYDATVICNTKATADSLAKANHQIAYFDLKNMEEIRVE